MSKISCGDRVRLPKYDFLSDGRIIKEAPYGIGYVVRLDEYAPNEYAYNTNEVLMFAEDIEVINE